MAGTKRGAHLALSLERLDALLVGDAERAGPADRAVGDGPAAGRGRHVPRRGAAGRGRPAAHPEDDRGGRRGAGAGPRGARRAAGAGLVGRGGRRVGRRTAQRPSIWPAVERRLLELVRQHRSTIVFSNSRRLAERLTARLNELAAEEAGGGGRREGRASRPSRPRRSGSPGSAVAHRPSSPRRTTDRCPASSGRWSRRSSRAGCCRASSRRRASSWASTWERSTSWCRWRRRRASPPGCSGSAAPGTRWAPCPGAWSSPSTAATSSRARWSPSGWWRGRSSRCATRATRSTCWPSTSWRWWRSIRGPSATWRRWCGGPRRSPHCPTPRCTPCSTCWPGGTRRRSSASSGRASRGTGSRTSCAAVRERSGWRSPPAAPSRTAASSRSPPPVAPTAAGRGSVSWTRRWSTSRGSATPSYSAPPAGGSRTSHTTA